MRETLAYLAINLNLFRIILTNKERYISWCGSMYGKWIFPNFSVTKKIYPTKNKLIASKGIFFYIFTEGDIMKVKER